MIYLAIPYTHADPAVMDARAEVADHVAALLTRAGYEVYSPISSWHHIAKKYDLPTDHAYWKRLNDNILSICDRLMVIKLDGWEESQGVQDEIEMAEGLCLEIIHEDAPEDYNSDGGGI